MNLNEFLNAVRPTLEPDIDPDRQRELLAGDEPANHDETVWLEWHKNEVLF